MSNKRRHKRKTMGQVSTGRNSARITTGQGAQLYNDATLETIGRLVPGVTLVFPTGAPDETDETRLSRARAMANALGKPHAATVRNDSVGTKYFRELVIGSAHELHFMYTKVQHVNVMSACPNSTVIVVFKPGHKDRIENGLCQVFFEPAPLK